MTIFILGDLGLTVNLNAAADDSQGLWLGIARAVVYALGARAERVADGGTRAGSRVAASDSATAFAHATGRG